VAGPKDEHLEAMAPALTEWLTACKWDDGKVRKTGTVMLVAESGTWKAWVHDRDAGRSTWLSAGSIVELLQSLERVCGGSPAEWRVDKK
jgi:hypothetical protein